MKFREIVASNSRRERFIYVMLGVWVIMGITGLFSQADLNQLANYFNAFAPYALAYLGAETLRPTGNELKLPKITKLPKIK